MQPISDMPDDDFYEAASLDAAELPICPVCTLEEARHVLKRVVFDAPKDGMSDNVRQMLRELLLVETGALVSNRTEAEQEDQASH